MNQKSTVLGIPNRFGIRESDSSPAHRDRAAEGCPIAALGSDLFRQDGATRRRFEDELRRTLAGLAGRLGGGAAADADARATALLATLVGTLVLARGVVDDAFSQAILRAGRHFLARSALPDATEPAASSP